MLRNRRDGDGTRTATLSTPYVNGQPQTAVLTAYFMSGAYEVTGSTVKKYYSIAGMTVAVNDGNGLMQNRVPNKTNPPPFRTRRVLILRMEA